jgi:predicted metal-binding protein
MRKFLGGLTAVAFLVALAAPAFAATQTVTGQIVDQMCYMKDMANNKGMDHKMPADTAGCAAACAKKGAPMALLTKDGKVYTIAGDLAASNNAKIVAHVSHTVEITGDVTTKDGKMTITSDALKMVSR